MSIEATEAGKAPDQSILYEIKHYGIVKDRFGNDCEMFSFSENVTYQQLLDAKQSLLNEIVKIDEKIAEIDKLK